MHTLSEIFINLNDDNKNEIMSCECFYKEIILKEWMRKKKLMSEVNVFIHDIRYYVINACVFNA